MISTKILIIINIVAITNTLPIIMGKSKVFNAFTISFPRPFQLKIYSTKTAPANNEANQPETAVTTGFNAFFKACLLIIWRQPQCRHHRLSQLDVLCRTVGCGGLLLHSWGSTQRQGSSDGLSIAAGCCSTARAHIMSEI